MVIPSGKSRIGDATSYFDQHRVTRIRSEDPLIVSLDASNLSLVLYIYYIYISEGERELISSKLIY